MGNSTMGKRYRILGEMGRGGMGVVYRAYDRLQRQEVALKRVSLDGITFNDTNASTNKHRVSLAQEFRTLATLRHPNIINVLDYGFDSAKTPYYTMELLEDAHPIVAYGKDLPKEKQVDLLVQMCQALLYLHRRGVLHRDLKPDNVQVRHEQVKVLDFGLAMLQGDAQPEEDLAGTLAYMAPELLSGVPPTPASDIYALGVIACEILNRAHPFAFAGSPQRMINAVLNEAPQLPNITDKHLLAVCERWIARDPADRYARIQDILRDLAPQQTLSQDVRESFLQGARFVGREQEFNQLTQWLQRAYDDHKGAFCLIAGEGGIGKSRLIDEFATLALVRGALVLRLQAQEDKSELSLWRDALRLLAIETPLDNKETSILKPLVGDIEKFSEVAPVALKPLDPQATRLRLQATVEDIFHRVTRPIVILAEDLHKIDDEFVLLGNIARLVTTRPFVIVGTYRQEEHPKLRDILQPTHHIALERLAGESIAQLTRSMLGESTQENVVDFIAKETEGNAYFMVEVVRALAEDAGNLDMIGQSTLPQSVFAGGIQQVVARRLSQLTPEAYHLLKLCAVDARFLDLPVLYHLEGQETIGTWLNVCADVAILNVADGKWQFVHDKLREGVLKQLSDNDLQASHQRLAEAIEAVYGDAPSQNERLAFHWGKAGNPAQEAHYARRAGEQALLTGSYQQALTWMKRAYTYAETSHAPALERAYLAQMMSQLSLYLGEIQQCYVYGIQALKIGGYPAQSGNAFSLVKQILRQLRTRLFGMPTPVNNPMAIIAVRACRYLSQSYYYDNDKANGVFYAIQGLNLAEAGGDSTRPERAIMSTNMGFALGLLRVRGISQHFFTLARNSIHDAEDADSLAWWSITWGVYQLGLGNWEAAEANIRQCIELAEGIGHLRRVEEAVAMLRYVMLFTDRYEEFIALNDRYIASSQRGNNVQALTSGLCDRAMDYLNTDRTQEAQALVAEIEKHSEIVSDASVLIRRHATLARIYRHAGNLPQARQEADVALAMISKTSPTAYYVREGYTMLLETYFDLYAIQPNPQLQTCIEATIKQLRRYTKVFPIGKPLPLFYEARVLQLAGKAEEATAGFKAAHALAESLGLKRDARIISGYLKD